MFSNKLLRIFGSYSKRKTLLIISFKLRNRFIILLSNLYFGQGKIFFNVISLVDLFKDDWKFAMQSLNVL